MEKYEEMFESVFENLKKIAYPEEWLSLDMVFSKSELFTMFLVERHGELIMTKIAENINVSMSTANGIVERLVKNGCLERERSDSDRRIVVIRLTDKGKKMVNELKTVVFGYIKRLYEVLDEEERRVIFKILAKIPEILNKGRESSSEEKSSIKKIEIE
jgi:DNA-binding MarR family transcriptional regulator